MIHDRRYIKDTKVVNPMDNPYVFEKMFRGNPYIKEVLLHKGTIYIEDKAFKDLNFINCKICCVSIFTFTNVLRHRFSVDNTDLAYS